MTRAVFDWWWNLDRRRRANPLAGSERAGPLDETFVVAAMARQIEEIRNLPEVSH